MATGNLSMLVTSGFDAFQNLYDVRINFPSVLADSFTGTIPAPAEVSVRALDFTPPELVVGSYKVPYKAVEITRLNSKIEGERKITIPFRLDSNYNLYSYLMAWKHYWMDPNDDGNINFGSYSSVINDLAYGTITVVGYRSSDTLNDIASDVPASNYEAYTWKFDNVICTKVGTPTYNRATGEAIQVTAEFLFGAYEEGANLLQS